MFGGGHWKNPTPCALPYIKHMKHVHLCMFQSHVFSNTHTRPMMHTSTFLIVIGWLKLVIGTNNVSLIGPD
jgi:hypothetical protein